MATMAIFKPSQDGGRIGLPIVAVNRICIHNLSAKHYAISPEFPQSPKNRQNLRVLNRHEHTIFLREQISFDILSSRDVMKESGIPSTTLTITSDHIMSPLLSSLSTHSKERECKQITDRKQTKDLKYSHRKADRRVCEISNDLVGFLFISALKPSAC
ncbi:hypothetical protein D3C87_1494640 [compost metagenome]